MTAKEIQNRIDTLTFKIERSIKCGNGNTRRVQVMKRTKTAYELDLEDLTEHLNHS